MNRLLIPLALGLAACDASPPPQPQADARQPNPAFETQIEAMEKARALEGQVVEQAESQKKLMDEAAQ